MMMGAAVVVATHAASDTGMYSFAALLGFGSGAALTCWHATVANYFGPAAFPSILGTQMPFSNMVAAASPFLVGLAYDAQGSYTTAFYIVATVSFIAAVLLLAASPPSRTGERARALPAVTALMAAEDRKNAAADPILPSA